MTRLKLDDAANVDSTVNIRNCLMYRIVNKEKQFDQHSEQKSAVMTLFQNTIQFGESNSALLIGSRGSGKTTLVETILKELEAGKNFEENVKIVKLNGLVHINDRISLVEMAQQLQLGNCVNDTVFGTFAENLTFLLDCLKSGNRKTSQPVIFILDEFDLFCAHKNQTLLYNLFDIAQSAQAPICVLGITHRFDVIELFEKRVKSRFSHRQIFMNYSNSKASNLLVTFSDYIKITKNILTLPNETMADEVELEYIRNLKTSVFNSWNKNIDRMMDIEAVENALEFLYDIDRNEVKLRLYLTLLLSNLSESHVTLDALDFQKTLDSMFQEDKCFIMQGLSILEVCLVVAMKHESDILDGEPFNFKMILQRYKQFQKTSEVKTVGDLVIMKAFEHLKNLELIIPVNKQRSKDNKEYQMYHFVMTREQVKEGIDNYMELPTEIKHWFTSLAVK